MDKSLSLSFENLKFQVNTGLFGHESKQVLKGIHGEFHSYELSAILGPSGSGKSSLLNALSGFKRGNVSGTIKINDSPVSHKVIRTISSYIMQENQIQRFLTVYETMMFATRFKKKCDKERNKIESILNSLGMKEKMNTFVMYLSGGEQKRLSVALELVDDPAILFLDEPTTGLDSSSAKQCIQFLQNLAKEGKIIICTIHSPAPNLLQMFDNIYAMADGNCIYNGSNRNLVPFLNELDLPCPETYNPSDFLLEIATDDYGKQNHRLTEKIGNGSCFNYRDLSLRHQNLIRKSLVIDSPSRLAYSLSFTQQVGLLLHRNFLISTRDKTLLMLRLCIHIVMGLIFGLLYRNVGNEASKFFDNYRYIIVTIVFQLYTSYFSLQTASKLVFFSL
jgi:ATP-binding cassette, subfamily G (WHITE), member 1